MKSGLPKSWLTVPLAEIAEINPRHAKELDDSIPVSFATMAALNENKPVFQFLEERPLGTVRKGFTHFAEGDVLFAKITPCMENGKGAVAIGLRNGLGCGTTEVHVLRPLAGMNPHYIYRFLAQPMIRREAKENFTGTAGQARVPTTFVEQLEMPLPPLTEQLRIVAKLEKILSKLDECQKRLEKIPIILKRFRQSFLAAACSGRLTADWRKKKSPKLKIVEDDLPAGWRSVCVGDVIQSLKYGTAQKCGYEKRGVPVLRIPNVINGVIDHSDLKYAKLPPKEFEQLRLKSGDILLIRSNGSVSLVGKCALVRKQELDFAYAGYLIRIRPEENTIASEFLNLVLSSYDIRLQIELEARSTSGVNNINSEEVKALHFLLPPLGEQREIICRVEALFAQVNKIETRYTKAKVQVDKLTQSILSKAFRGELVPQNPNDEPTEKLLERIRTLKNQSESTPIKRNQKVNTHARV